MVSLPLNKKKNGFTLIELLIVMMIIGVLATITTFNFNEARTRARDTQRRSDIKQYDEALKSFAARNQGFYPNRAVLAVPASDNNGGTNLCTDLGLTGCPADPQDGAIYRYYYRSNGNCSAGVVCAPKYWLYARLEETANIYYIVCSDGKIGTRTTPPANTNCPL